MRKALFFTLLMVCLLSFTLPVSANSMFADLPSTHWAYGAVKQLVAEDVIAGDIERFKPGKRISRYEAAMLVANGYTKLSSVTPAQKATLAKLGQEFKAELEKLGALPAPPAPAKKANKFNILIEERLQFNTTSLGRTDVGGAVGATNTVANKNQYSQRLRIFFNAPVGDEWMWDARYYQQKLYFGGDDTTGNTNGKFDRFWVTGKNFLGTKGSIELGKQWAFPGKGTFFGVLGDLDGAFYTYKDDKFKLKFGTGKSDSPLNGVGGSTDLTFAEFSVKPSPKFDFGGFVLTHSNTANVKDIKMLSLNAAVGFDNGHALSFEWAKNSANGSAYHNKSGWIIAYNSHYRNTWRTPPVYDAAINPFKKGDWAWAISYRHMPAGVAGLMNRGAACMVPFSTDVNGSYINNINDVNVWRVDFYTVPWKNVVWAIIFESAKDIKGRWTNNNIQTALLFYFK